MCFLSAKKLIAHFSQNHWSQQLFEVLFLFPMCRNGGLKVSTFYFYYVRLRRYRPLIIGDFRRNVLFQHSKAKLLFWSKRKITESSSDVILVRHTSISGSRYQKFLATMYGSGAMADSKVLNYGRNYGCIVTAYFQPPVKPEPYMI